MRWGGISVPGGQGRRSKPRACRDKFRAAGHSLEGKTLASALTRPPRIEHSGLNNERYKGAGLV